jgi:WD40 repeat protein
VLWRATAGTWTTADLASPYAILAGHEQIDQLAFDQDGSTLASVSDDGTTGLWDTDVDHAAHAACQLAGAPTHPQGMG